MIIKRIVNFKLMKMEEIRKKFMLDMYNLIEVVEKYNRMIKVVWNFYGRLLDIDQKELKKINLTTIKKFAQFLEKDPAIMEIATLLGRFKGVSQKFEEIIYEKLIIKQVWKQIRTWPEEIVGATEGKELEHMFPFELVYLSRPELKPIFYKKFFEGKLTQFEFLSLDLAPEKVIDPEVINVSLPLEQGPFIVCIDNSASMKGAAEYIAKALCLAISKIALQEKRDCYLINFATGFNVIDLNKNAKSIVSLSEFLSKTFDGYTNLDLALEHVFETMSNKRYFNADLLLISDFIAKPLDEEIIQQMQFLRESRNRFHGVEIGTMGDKILKSAFDNVWVYDPKDPFTSDKIIERLRSEFDSKLN